MIKKIEDKSTINFKKYFLILVTVLLVIIGAVYYNHYPILKFSSKETVSHTSDSNASEHEVQECKPRVSQERDKALDRTLIPTESNNVVAPENVVPKAEIISQAEITKDKPSSSSLPLVQSEDYINYLHNVNHIVVNFFQDKSYTEQIKAVKIAGLPQKLEDFIDCLNDYNDNYLVSPHSYRDQVFPLNSSVLQKFIHIEKNSTEYEAKQASRDKIIKGLKSWIEFCYSKDFQKKFIGQSN